MTWPPTATRAEILRILEINAHIYTEWVITRAETEAVLALLGWRAPDDAGEPELGQAPRAIRFYGDDVRA